MNANSLMPVVLTALSVALVCSVLIAIYFWRKLSHLEKTTSLLQIESHHKHEQAVQTAVNQERDRAREALNQAEHRFSQTLEDQKNSSLSVVVHPFVNTEAQRGVFTKETKVEIGYKYQLFVQGLPCFEPHTMVLESTAHKEVDQETLDFFKTKAEQAAEAAVLVKGGGAAKTAITIAKTVFKLAR